MNQKKSPEREAGGITVLSKEAVLVIEEISAKIGSDIELQELKNLIDISLHRSLADQLDLGMEDVRKRAWEIADNIIFTWLAFQSPEAKAKFLHLFKRVTEIFGEGWDYFDIIAGHSGQITPSFADLDRLNNLTPTVEIRQNNWPNQTLEFRKEHVGKKFAEQIKVALNTLREINRDKGVSLSDAYQFGDEIVVALANLDYKELCQANVIANLITEMIRRKIGVNIGFCINKTPSDGFIN